MSTRTLLMMSFLIAGIGCKHQDQGPGAEEAQSEAPEEAQGETPGAAGQEAPAAGGQQTPGATQGERPQGGTGAEAPGSPGAQSPGTEQPGAGAAQGGAQGGAQQDVTAVKMVELDCSSAGASHKGWVAEAPQGATCTKTADALLIQAGDDFKLLVREHGTDMAARRRAIENDPNRKLRRYTMDTPDAIVYEVDSPSGKPEYGFIAIKRVGNKTVVCEGERGQSLTQPQAEMMVKTCQSLTKR